MIKKQKKTCMQDDSKCRWMNGWFKTVSSVLIIVCFFPPEDIFDSSPNGS